MSMKTLYTAVSFIFLVIVTSVVIAGYITSHNRTQQEVVTQTEVQVATSTQMVQSTTTKATDIPPQKKTITIKEVEKHASINDCWIIVEDKVYSVASFISMHPGGSAAITTMCGQDATTAFQTRGGTGVHSSKARATLGSMFIGDLATE